MEFIPKKYAELLKKNLALGKDEFIKKCKNADPSFIALIETMHESKDFEHYPERQKQFIKDFIQARKL